jgi:hypothetical protein
MKKSLTTLCFVLISLASRSEIKLIELLNWSAAMEANQPVLRWTTSYEIDNKLFIIERSTDCINFEVIGTLTGASHSAKENSYSFIDANPASGILYYRLKSIDGQNVCATSKVVTVDNRIKKHEAVIFPCPFKNQVNITFNETELPAESKIIIYGSTGKELYNINASEAQTLDLSGLQKGTYYFTVQSNGQRLIETKLLKNED